MESGRHSRLLAAFALLALLVRLPALVFPVFGEPEARDAAVAVAVSAGERLYVDVPAAEPPLGYGLLSAIDAISGPFGGRAHHLVGLVAVLLTMGVLAFAATALSGDRGRPLAALFYGVFSVALPPEAMGATVELCAALLGALAVWLALGAAPARRFGLLFLAGAFAALAALIRVEAFAVVLAVPLYLALWRPAALGRGRLVTGLVGAGVFFAAAAITFAVVLAWLYDRGALGAFAAALWRDEARPAAFAAAGVGLFAVGTAFLWGFGARELWRTIRGLRIEASPVAPNADEAGATAPQRAARGSRSGPSLTLTAAPNGTASKASGSSVEESSALDALAGRALRGEDDAAVALAGTWLGLSLVALVVRARFAGGDFVALVAPLCLLAARGAASIADDFWSGRSARVFRLGVALPVALFFGAALFHETLHRTLGAPAAKPRVVVNALRKLAPEGPIGVVGPMERVYAYARRAPARGWLGRGEGAPATMPVLVVDASARTPPFLPATCELAEVVEGARLWRPKAKQP